MRSIIICLLACAALSAQPLHQAVYDDDLPAAMKLLRDGADVKAPNRYGVTPLSMACTNGNAAMAEMLINAGADANGMLPGGESALMTAARTGRVEAVEVLIAHGAKVNYKDPRGAQTALMWAAAEGNADVVEALLKAGAELHAQLDSGYTPFLFAVREGRMNVVKSLLKAGISPNETVEAHKAGGLRPASGAGVPRNGVSALVLAVSNAHNDLAAFLLDAGADPNAATAGYTALHVITNIRKSGGGDNDPPPQGSGNTTSLDLVRKLVRSGADINARMTKPIKFGLTGLNTMGATPFMLAAKTADAELLKLLASLGADTKINNVDNATPLMAAAGLGTRSPGEDAGTEDEVVEALRVLLDLGQDINAADNNGETAMHGAAYKNSPKAVEFLASKGAKREIWDKPNKQGWTPLTIAEGHRFGNFKPSFVTVDAFHRVMGIAPTPSSELQR